MKKIVAKAGVILVLLPVWPIYLLHVATEKMIEKMSGWNWPSRLARMATSIEQWGGIDWSESCEHW